MSNTNIKKYSAKERQHIKIEGKFDSWQNFSFGNWYNEERIGFNTLKVFNDDTIAPDSEIGMHPHKNYEILSVMLNGKMSHKDSLGNYQEINDDAIQLISCGTGIFHSGKNLAENADTHFLQIWVEPNILDTKPDLQLKQFSTKGTKEKWDLRVSPFASENKIHIKQNCFCSRGNFTDDTFYEKYDNTNDIWLFVVNGSIEVGGVSAKKGDALMITEIDKIIINVNHTADIWLMELAKN
jgi:quercetin 2,3-dioxygenase